MNVKYIATGEEKGKLTKLNLYARLQWSTVVSITVSDKFLRLIILCKKNENKILAGLS